MTFFRGHQTLQGGIKRKIVKAILNPYYNHIPFLCTLKTSENQEIFDIFRDYRNRAFAFLAVRKQ